LKGCSPRRPERHRDRRRIDRQCAVWLRVPRPVVDVPSSHTLALAQARAVDSGGHDRGRARTRDVLERGERLERREARRSRKSDLVTAVGNLLGIQTGESLRLSGRWANDKKYGEQFKVESYLTVKPATLVGIEKYLGSGLVKGVGKVTAERLVKHFGLETLEVIDERPERLPEVEGIGPVRSERITTAWVEQRRIKDVMLFLQSHGVSTTYAVRIYKQYKDRSIAVVRENPYQLAIDTAAYGSS
jgi:ATP-dependent exoDNAse (exonuclease V) alpha subunit